MTKEEQALRDIISIARQHPHVEDILDYNGFWKIRFKDRRLNDLDLHYEHTYSKYNRVTKG